jgi:hypothetical protein
MWSLSLALVGEEICFSFDVWPDSTRAGHPNPQRQNVQQERLELQMCQGSVNHSQRWGSRGWNSSLALVGEKIVSPSIFSQIRPGLASLTLKHPTRAGGQGGVLLIYSVVIY